MHNDESYQSHAFFPTTWASSSLALAQVVMKQHSDCFWKKVSPFFEFFLLTAF